MKKAFFLMLGLCVASAASAVQLSWEAAFFEDYTVTTRTAALIYTAETDTASITTDSVLALAQNGTAATGLENVTDTSDGSAYETNSMVSWVNVTTAGQHTDTGTYYIVVWDSTDGTQYAIAEVSASETANAWYGSIGPGTSESTYSELTGLTWTGPLAVPEPTTLALLALGVAGLALRRRA